MVESSRSRTPGRRACKSVLVVRLERCAQQQKNASTWKRPRLSNSRSPRPLATHKSQAAAMPSHLRSGTLLAAGNTIAASNSQRAWKNEAAPPGSGPLGGPDLCSALRQRPSPQLRTRWTYTEEVAISKRAMRRFADRAIHRLTSLFAPPRHGDMGAAAAESQRPQDLSTHSLPEFGDAHEFVSCLRSPSDGMRRVLYRDDMYELLDAPRATSVSPRDLRSSDAKFGAPTADESAVEIRQRSLSDVRSRSNSAVLSHPTYDSLWPGSTVTAPGPKRMMSDVRRLGEAYSQGEAQQAHIHIISRSVCGPGLGDESGDR
jgi:hypothetical protein